MLTLRTLSEIIERPSPSSLLVPLPSGFYNHKQRRLSHPRKRFYVQSTCGHECQRVTPLPFILDDRVLQSTSSAQLSVETQENRAIFVRVRTTIAIQDMKCSISLLLPATMMMVRVSAILPPKKRYTRLATQLSQKRSLQETHGNSLSNKFMTFL